MIEWLFLIALWIGCCAAMCWSDISAQKEIEKGLDKHD